MSALELLSSSRALTREDALLDPSIVRGARIPLIGSVASTAIALYSLTMAARYSFSSKVIVLVENKDVSESFAELKGIAFLKVAGFHSVNVCSLGFFAYFYQEKEECFSERLSSRSLDSVDCKNIMRQMVIDSFED